ncbi:MAG: hypothetical protein ACFB0G_11280 [Leptolyngbyaceae cyanobacterium]
MTTHTYSPRTGLHIPRPKGCPPRLWPEQFRSWGDLATHLESLRSEADVHRANLNYWDRPNIKLTTNALTKYQARAKWLRILEQVIPALERVYAARQRPAQPAPVDKSLHAKVQRLESQAATNSAVLSGEVNALRQRLETLMTPQFIQGVTLLKQMAATQQRRPIGYGAPPPRMRIDSPDEPTIPFSDPINVPVNHPSSIDSVIERYGPKTSRYGTTDRVS